MNKKSKNLLILIFGLITLIGFSLYFTTLEKTKDDNLTFYAMVKEVYEGSAILIPFPNNEARLNYTELSANISNVQIGEIIKVVCLPEIKETFPAGIEIVSYQPVMKPITTTTTTSMPAPEEIPE